MKEPGENSGAKSPAAKEAVPRAIKDMRVVLQQKANGHYLRAPGDWTTEREEAIAFAGSKDALDYCDRNGIRDISLRYCFPDIRFDFCLQPFDRGHSQAPQHGSKSTGRMGHSPLGDSSGA